MSKKSVFTVVILVLVIAFVWWFGADQAVAPDIDVARISEEVLAGEAVLLDVRTAEELEQEGFALNSLHFDVARLEAGELPDITTDTKVYTYCKGGARAGTAEEILEANGFASVQNIGGLSDWEAAGGAIVH